MIDRVRLINELKKAKNKCLIYESGGCLACKYRGQADCTLENLADHLLEMQKGLKAEAYQKFAKLLKSIPRTYVYKNEIDNALEELVGDLDG